MGYESKEKKDAMQAAFVEARINGKTQDEAKTLAGYSPNSDGSVIAAHTKSLMVKALEEKGITEEYVAKKYREGIDASLNRGAKEKDINGMAQLLKQLGWLMGYGKTNPSVAVQINNTQNNIGASPQDEPVATAELIGQVSELVETLKAGIGERQSSGIYEGDIVPEDPAPHDGVVEPPFEQPPVGGGGLA